MIEAKIDKLFNIPSEIEIIRDQLSGIIQIEMDNQYKIAVDAGDEFADDYLCRVLVENPNPLEAGGDVDFIPVINISVQRLEDPEKNGSASVNGRNFKGVIDIDCFQSGTTSDKKRGRRAAILAYKLARCVFGILYYDDYTYLGLQGLVQDRRVASMQGGYPDTENSALSIYGVKLSLEVEFVQSSFTVVGEDLELIPVKITDSNGQVVIEV